MSEIINVPMAQQRDIKTVTAEIRTLTIQGQRLALEYAIEIGRRLKEAKSMLAHGQWGPWLKEEVEFSQSSANNFMRIFEEYGADQISIFGAEAESKTLGNLPYTKALKLLAMPAEEREAFVENNDVAHMSSRELEQAIREREQAIRERDAVIRERKQTIRERDAAIRERDAAKKHACDMALKADAAKANADTLRDQLAEKEAKRQDLMTQIKNLERELEDAEAEAKASVDATDTADREKEIREAAYQEAHDIYESKKAEAVKEAEAAASEKAKAREDKLKKQVAEKTKQVEEIREEMEKLRKQLATASPDTAQFKILFEAVQTDFNRMLGLLLKIRQEDADRGQKLTKAVTTVLEAWGKQVTA